MSYPRREPQSQHFLCNPPLVDQLVRASSLSKNDLVLEIGPGRGALTRALLAAAGQVIAVERDPALCAWLRAHLPHPRLQLVEADFRAAPLPAPPYKVFANLPYAITADAIRKLLLDGPSPSECWLILQKEAADKFIPGPPHTTLAANLYYPWWQLRLAHTFRRADFAPPPAVDSVLLHIARRPAPLLPIARQPAYHDFVADRFIHDPRARCLPPARLIALFEHFQRSAAPRQWQAVRGAFARLQAQQARLEKIHRSRADPNWRRFKEK